jgi:hypothetical protein
MPSIPKVILDWNPRVVPIQKGRKGPTMPRWTETQVRAKDVKFGPNDDKYGIVLDADTLVIDIDVHDPAKNGYAALERLSKDCGVDLLDVAAFVVESPSGGRHLYFSKASDLKLPKSTQQYAGLDFLSEGCQVIGAGSTHVDGGEYCIETSAEDVPVNEAPLPPIAPLLAPRAPDPSPIPTPRPTGGYSPLDDFNKSEEAVQYVKAAMVRAGYEMIFKGDGTYEYVRPGKRESSHKISGTLGRSISTNGNILLKSFSTNDPHFGAESATLSEAFRVLGNHTREELPALLRSFGFGEDGYSLDLDGIKFDLGNKSESEEISDSYPQLTLDEMAEQTPDRRKYVISGLLRQGEVLNVIAAPKTGKSWFVYNLALTLANGGDFLGFTSPKDLNCLIVDNELHQNELVWRLRKVEDALDLKAGKNLRVTSLRGSGLDIGGLEVMMETINASQYDVIVLDALYRFLPEGTSENDNAQMMKVYNALDRIGRVYDTSIIVVHHTSKGNQSEKSVTDIGAGAGSISRAADSQLVLVPHDIDGLVCVEAVTRSSKAPEPFSAALSDGKWRRVDAIDPERKGAAGEDSREAKKEAFKQIRIERAKKFLEYFKENDKVSKVQAEEIWGDGSSEGAFKAFLSKQISGRAIVAWAGQRYCLLPNGLEILEKWIEDDCPLE